MIRTQICIDPCGMGRVGNVIGSEQTALNHGGAQGTSWNCAGCLDISQARRPLPGCGIQEASESGPQLLYVRLSKSVAGTALTGAPDNIPELQACCSHSGRSSDHAGRHEDRPIPSIGLL